MGVNTLTYITLIVTYQCPARCAHCCIGAGGMENGEWMSVEDAEYYLSEATRNNDITWMTLIGGEALLDLNRTIEIGKIALAHGIPTVKIDTNSAWCVDEQVAESTLGKIYEAGLMLGAVSVDAFHQRFVPRERALYLMRAAEKLGIGLEGNSTILEAEEADNAYDEESRELTGWFGERGFQVSPGTLVFQGRAVQLAGIHTGPRSIPEDRCEGVYFFATRDFRQPGGIQIDLEGWVMVDHGICIGNARQRSLGEILADYDADSHPIISVLMDEGPIGLTRIPEANGFQLREEGYVDKCHLCQEIRTYLRPRFPGVLEPERYYPPIS